MLEAQRVYGKTIVRHDSPGISLGRNLYPTLPEDRFDRGPVRIGPFVGVADTRLDNRDDVGRALGWTAPLLAEKSDSEVLVEAVVRWGAAALDRLAGDFAFALYDTRSRELLMARDAIGNRPLFFHRGQDFVAFSSMPSGLHALPSIERAFDADTLTELLALFPQTGRQTVYRGIERIPPGHLARVKDGQVTVTRYWHPPRPERANRSPAEIEDGLRDIVDRTIKAQIRRPSGALSCQLSGGLDSSIVASSAALQIDPEALLAFTAVPRRGFAGPVPDQTYADEGPMAARLAALYPNIRHSCVEPGNEKYRDLLDRQTAFIQEPTPNPCNASYGRDTYRAAIARGASVMLVGFRGNLSITYSGLEVLPGLVRQGRLTKALGLSRKVAAIGVPWRTLMALGLGPQAPDWLWRLACRLYGRPTDLSGYTAVSAERRRWLDERAEQEGVDFLYRAEPDSVAMRFESLSDGGNGCYHKGVLAEFGLSLRDPSTDRQVIDYCFAVPPEEFIRDGVPRSLARRAFGDRLPPEIRDNHQRGLQASDWYVSVTAQMPDLRAEFDAIQRCGPARQAMDFDWLGEALDSWPADGDWAGRGVEMRHRHGMLRAISAGHFMRKVSGTN